VIAGQMDWVVQCQQVEEIQHKREHEMWHEREHGKRGHGMVHKTVYKRGGEVFPKVEHHGRGS